MSERKAILVVGAGDATGGAMARRCAREGCMVCMTRGAVPTSWRRGSSASVPTAARRMPSAATRASKRR